MQFHMIGTFDLHVYRRLYGAYVRHTKSSLACPDVPLCSRLNHGLPSHFQEYVQMYRTAALLLFVWILVAFAHAVRSYKDQNRFLRAG